MAKEESLLNPFRIWLKSAGEGVNLRNNDTHKNAAMSLNSGSIVESNAAPSEKKNNHVEIYNGAKETKRACIKLIF